MTLLCSCAFIRNKSYLLTLLWRVLDFINVVFELYSSSKNQLTSFKNFTAIGHVTQHASLTTCYVTNPSPRIKTMCGLTSGLQIVVFLCLRGLSFLSYLQLFVSIIEKKKKENS